MKRRSRFDPIRPSTRAFAREARRMPGYSLFDWLHGYVYARWPYLYIGIGTGQHPLSRVFAPPVRLVGRLLSRWSDGEPEGGTFADGYHGKVVPLEAAVQLVTVQEDVNLGDLEQTIPYALARDIVLKNPDHIVVLECPCRTARENPCLPLDVCLVIGEPFASFVIEHHVTRARWISQEEAVQILHEEDERGHVHHAFFKDAMFGRFYAICNCCACCCGAMQSHRNGTPMLASSGFVCAVVEKLCIGCGVCSEYCQFEALSVSNECCRVDTQACMGCGVCEGNCPSDAITLREEPEKGGVLDIDALRA